MSEDIVRCPFCVQDDHFKPMKYQGESFFVCAKCGHRARPLDASYSCFCLKCQELSKVA
jgi:hypothetical protein